MSYKYTAIAEKYAKNVLSGKIKVCRWVFLACRRHVTDVSRSKKKNYPYRFDKSRSEHFLDFTHRLRHVKGKWAKQPVIFEPHQCFVYAVIFGWVHKSTGKRRFTEAYQEKPRKNGKSLEAVAVSLYTAFADGEFGAEIYCGATTEKQAMMVFEPARLMCKRDQDLREYFDIQVNAKNLNSPKDNSKIEPVVGDPGDGGSPHCFVIDEYHEHQKSNMYDTAVTGMGAREQPLVFIITTAGSNLASPCYVKRKEIEAILEGSQEDENVFGVIYSLDDDDDWTTEEALHKANPNIGVSVSLEYLRSQQRKAINNPRHTNTFKTKHLNIWGGAKSAFFNMQDWQNCFDESLKPGDLVGSDEYFALDLAKKLDLNAGVGVYAKEIEGKLHYYCVSPKFWIPHDTVFNSDDESASQRYQGWVESGYLEDTDGAEMDYLYILEDIKERASSIQEIPIDPHGGQMLTHRLQDEAYDVVEVIQNYTNMSTPMKELEAAIKSGRFHHDGNPILTWCISNVIGKELPGSDDIVRPTKDKATNAKIDGATALIMAIGRALDYHHGATKQSVYDESDVLC